MHKLVVRIIPWRRDMSFPVGKVVQISTIVINLLFCWEKNLLEIFYVCKHKLSTLKKTKKMMCLMYLICFFSMWKCKESAVPHGLFLCRVSSICCEHVHYSLPPLCMVSCYEKVYWMCSFKMKELCSGIRINWIKTNCTY